MLCWRAWKSWRWPIVRGCFSWKAVGRRTRPGWCCQDVFPAECVYKLKCDVLEGRSRVCVIRLYDGWRVDAVCSRLAGGQGIDAEERVKEQRGWWETQNGGCDGGSWEDGW